MMSEEAHSNNNKRIAKNTILLYVRMIFLMFLGFYASRVTLQTLGQEDYGIYNIVGQVIVLFQFLNATLTSATQRYLNIALGEGNEENIKKVFSICMRVYLILSVIVFFLNETVCLFQLNFYLKIPEERKLAANLVFQFSCIALFFNMLRIPFNSAIIATEKMNFFAYVSIIEGIFKIVIVFALLLGNNIDKLILYSILVTLISIVILLIYYIYCKKNINFINFRKYKDKELIKSLFKFSAWNVIGSFTSIAVNYGLNTFINRFFGVILNAATGIASQASSAISNFLSNFQTAFNPQMVKSYAQKDMDYVFDFTYKASKYSFFLMYFIILPFAINMDFVLNLWLAEVPAYTTDFIKVMLIMILVDAVTEPFWMLVMADGDIKKYQIVGALTGLMILPVAYILLRLGFPPASTFAVKTVHAFLFGIWRFIYLKKKVGMPVLPYVKNIFVKLILITFISYPLVKYIYKLLLPCGTIIQFFVSCITSCVVLGLLYWFLGINDGEKKAFINFCNKKFKKK